MDKEYKLDFENLSLVIEKIIFNFKNNNLQILHRIDEGLLESGIVNNNQNSIDLAVVCYSLRKLLSKKHITSNEKWVDIKQNILITLESAFDFYNQKDLDKYNSKIKEIEVIIKDADFVLGHFVLNLLENARNKLASSAYGYGLSLSKASNLLNADKEQVMEIIGNTKMSDEDERTKSILERVNYIQKKDIIDDN